MNLGSTMYINVYPRSSSPSQVSFHSPFPTAVPKACGKNTVAPSSGFKYLTNQRAYVNIPAFVYILRTHMASLPRPPGCILRETQISDIKGTALSYKVLKPRSKCVPTIIHIDAFATL